MKDASEISILTRSKTVTEISTLVFVLTNEPFICSNPIGAWLTLYESGIEIRSQISTSSSSPSSQCGILSQTNFASMQTPSLQQKSPGF